jgi:hypothetical protein
VGGEGLDSSSKGRPHIRASFTWGRFETIGSYTWILEYSSSIANSKNSWSTLDLGLIDLGAIF